MLYNAAKLLLFCELSKYFNTFCYLCRKFLVMKISKNRYLQGFFGCRAVAGTGPCYFSECG